MVHLKIFGVVIGKKYLTVIPRILPSLMCYGVCGALGIIYIFDIPMFVKHIPFYRDRMLYPYENDKMVRVLPSKEWKDVLNE